MSFTSSLFVFFLLGLTVLYYLTPGRWQWLVLLVGSYGFYMAGGVKTVVYLLFTTLTTYAAALLLGRLNEHRADAPEEGKKEWLEQLKRRKQLVVAAACLANFGLLYILKYWNFTAEALTNLSGGFVSLPAIDLLMPLGISFYMFQSIGYVVDCYRGKYPPERSLLRYALFISFFPQVIQGPISRFDQLGHQLTAPHPFRAENLRDGMELVMWGYFKKLVIADRAAIVVNTVFDHYPAYSGSVIAFAVFFYSIQLYCDFSGGIDITRGAAKMLGIDLADNFARPIFATSLAEYWRRWHITLGSWMKDYVFYSLTLSKPFLKLGKFTRRKIGGKLGKVIPTSAATFVVYLVIGIWHGANFRYIFYGLWNGAIITSSLLLSAHYLALREKLGIAEDSRALRVFRMARTWLLVFLGRYITRAPRLLASFSMLWATVSRPGISDLWNGTLLSLGLPGGDFIVVFLAMAVVLVVEYFQEKGVRIRETLSRQSFALQWLVVFLSLVILLLFGIMRGSYISSEFIYKQF